MYSVGDKTVNAYGAVGGMRIGRRNRITWRKPARHFFTINPTLPHLGSKPGRSGEKPETNRLSYGTAYLSSILISRNVCFIYYIYTLTITLVYNIHKLPERRLMAYLMALRRLYRQ
jgi:hypothetical protein